MTKQAIAPWWLALLCGLLIYSAQAVPEFPQLQGRVSDYGEFLDSATERVLTNQLAAHENATGNQVVVATFQDIQGYPIEQYGYQLGRAWGIGEKDKNNGVLLIIARAERKVRIEVGYGLEGTLTDAISANIIHTIIEPAFKRGQFSQGISDGVSAIIAALGGEYSLKQPQRGGNKRNFFLIVFIAMIFWPFLFMIIPSSLTGRPRLGGGFGGGYYGGGFGGGGFGGGGVSGGGGGFGGGGASGGW